MDDVPSHSLNHTERQGKVSDTIDAVPSFPGYLKIQS